MIISQDFIKVFPETKDPDIQGITVSCFSVSSISRNRIHSPLAPVLTDAHKLGNLLGCLLAATFGDRLGRKNTLRYGGVVSAIGAVLQFTAYSFPQLIVGRVVNGIGNGTINMPFSLLRPDMYGWLTPLRFTGILSSTCGIFQAESCASDRRGKLSVIVVLHNVVFYCIATWLTLACSFADGGWQWRLPLAVQVPKRPLDYVRDLTLTSPDCPCFVHVHVPLFCA